MRPWRGATLLGLLAWAGVFAVPLGAQSVVQVEGGGNTITGGYGSRVQFWGGGYEGWIGAGYSRGWRLGFFAKHPLGLDTIRVGFDAVPLGLTTDLFSGGSYLLTQGVAWRRKRSTFEATLFGGATGVGGGAPFVNTARADKPLGMLALDYRPVPALLLRTQAVAARRQTLLENMTWRSENGVHRLGASGGVGSNHPYGAVSWQATTPYVDLRAGYADFARGFQRADAPLPNIAEPYHENVLLTLRAPKRAMLTLGHQNFRQEDSLTIGVARASVDQAVANVALLGFNVGGGVFYTEATDGRSLSTFNSINRALPFAASGTVMLFQTFRRGTLPIRTMQGELRERLSSKLSIAQVFSQTGKSLSAGLGGTFQHGFTVISVDYQNYYVPLRQPNPFMRALNLTMRLQIGSSSASIGSSIDPFGRVTYSASGSTYLYLGEPTPGVQPIPIRFQRYVIRGIVVDETGNPIDGAAVDLGGELAMTNSRGEFFLRTKNARATPLKLSFDEFIAVGQFELVSAPSTVMPAEEERASVVRIVLRPVALAQSREKAKLLGIQPQGAPRSGPANAPTRSPSASVVPLPNNAPQLYGAAARRDGAQLVLREVWRAALDVVQPPCCRRGDAWRFIQRPLPWKM
jgi:hypothetical protein